MHDASSPVVLNMAVHVAVGTSANDTLNQPVMLVQPHHEHPLLSAPLPWPLASVNS